MSLRRISLVFSVMYKMSQNAHHITFIPHTRKTHCNSSLLITVFKYYDTKNIKQHKSTVSTFSRPLKIHNNSHYFTSIIFNNDSSKKKGKKIRK